jgi:hypothetical protein
MYGRHTRPLRSIAEVFRMVVRRRCAVLLFVVSSLPGALCAQQQRDQCATAIPPNIEAGVFARDMIALLRRSETFRCQCARIAQARGVRVTIEIAFNLDSGRAQTAIHRDASGAIRAEVVVLFGENYRELLAHEFEHVLEQMDGVDLRQEAAQGRAWLLPGGAFETRRALATGVQVLREAEPVHAHAAAVSATR